MSSDAKDLQVILRAQERRNNNSRGTSEVLKEMKSGLTSQFRWEEMLQAAPIAISGLGACYVAGASPEVEKVQLQSPDGGFKYLRLVIFFFGIHLVALGLTRCENSRHKELKPNLAQCGTLGRHAFLEAEKSMGLTNHELRSMDNSVSASRLHLPIISVLLTPAASLLPRTVQNHPPSDWGPPVRQKAVAGLLEQNQTVHGRMSQRGQTS